MKRREFIAGIGSAAAWPLAARAQKSDRVRRIAVLMGLDENDPEAQQRFTAFREALRKLGWIENDKIRMVARWAAGSVEGTQNDAFELIGLRPDVIVVNTPIGLAALQDRTKTIPIVFVQVVEAGENGISSTAHPGGNVTGFYAFFEYAMVGKWLGLLQRLAPGVKRVALMQNPEHPAWNGYLSSIRPIAASVGIEVIPAGVRNAGEIDRVIENFGKEPNGGLIVLPDTFTTAHRDVIVEAAARLRLPSISSSKSFATAGALMSYGADLADLLRQSASYVDRILRGEMPGELPIQASTKFELVINRQAARTLGLEIPATLLALADEVID
jgi:putative tryptophan/tyrosine transport system substrate-binding protein